MGTSSWLCGWEGGRHSHSGQWAWHVDRACCLLGNAVRLTSIGYTCPEVTASAGGVQNVSVQDYEAADEGWRSCEKKTPDLRGLRGGVRWGVGGVGAGVTCGSKKMYREAPRSQGRSRWHALVPPCLKKPGLDRIGLCLAQANLTVRASHRTACRRAGLRCSSATSGRRQASSTGGSMNGWESFASSAC